MKTGPKNILLVEDEPIIALVEKSELEKYGYTVVHVSSGEQAIKASVESDPPIDLILMDINLGPGIDGTQAAEKILRVNDIPVVFLSSHTEKEIVEKTERISSYGYVVKNSGITVLDASIKMALKLHHTKNLLSEHESKLDSIIANSSALIVLSDLNAYARYVSAQCKQVTGYDQDYVIGRSLVSIVHPDDTLVFDNAYQRLLADGTPIRNLRFRCKDPAGSIRWLSLSASKVVINAKSNLVQNSILDITQQKKMEEALRTSEASLRSMLNAITESALLLTPEGIVVDANETVALRFGTTPQAMLGTSVYDYLPAKVVESRKQAVAQVLATKKALQFEDERFGRHLLNSLYPVLDHDQEVKFIAVVGLDITQRRAVEDALKEQEDRYSRAIMGIGGGLWDWDLVKNRVYYSEQWQKMLGYEEHEIEQSFAGWQKLWHPDDAEAIQRAVKDYMDGKTEFYEIEHRLRHKDGRWIWIFTRGELERDAQGQPLRWTGINIDISDRKQVEEQLRKQVSEKETLLKEIHHRVKNNTISIESLLAIEAESTDHPEVKAALQKAIARIQSMRILYENLLISTDYDEVSIQRYLHTLTHSICKAFADEQLIRLSLEIEDFTLPSRLVIALGIIVNELMTNVFKYAFSKGQSGAVKVSLTRCQGRATLVVADNGKGHPSSTPLNGTHHFGLTLVGMLAEQLGGSFSTHSDHGTRCVLEFKV